MGSVLPTVLGVCVLAVMLAALAHLGLLLRDERYRQEHGGVGAFVFALVFFPLAPLIWLGPYFGYIRPKRIDRRVTSARARLAATLAARARGEPHHEPRDVDVTPLELLDRAARTHRVLRIVAVVGLLVGFGSLPVTKAGAALDAALPVSVVLFLGGLVAVVLLVGLTPSNAQWEALAFEQFAALNGFAYDPTGSADSSSTRARTLLGSLVGALPEAAVTNIVTGQLADSRPFSRCTFTGNDLTTLGGWGLGSFFTVNVMTLELDGRAPHVLVDCLAETGQSGDPSSLVRVPSRSRRRLGPPYDDAVAVHAVSDLDPATAQLVTSLVRAMGVNGWFASFEIVDNRLHLYAPGVHHPAEWYRRSFAFAGDAASIVAGAPSAAADLTLLPRTRRHGAHQVLQFIALAAFVVAFFTGAQRGAGWSIAAVVALVAGVAAYGWVVWLMLRRRIAAGRARRVLEAGP